MGTAIDTLLSRSPDVCGGRMRIDGTRVTVHQIATYYQQGWTPEEIADQYPHITLAQVYAALAYYHANRDEVDRELEQETADLLRLQDELANPKELSFPFTSMKIPWLGPLLLVCAHVAPTYRRWSMPDYAARTIGHSWSGQDPTVGQFIRSTFRIIVDFTRNFAR